MMTKSDFEAVARDFRTSVDNLHGVRQMATTHALIDTMTNSRAFALEVLAYNMAQTFARINPRFDHKVFYKACGFDMHDNYPIVFPV